MHSVWLLLTRLRLKLQSMRPIAKPISIAPTPCPTLHTRVPPIATLTTRTDSHFLIFSQCSNNATNTSHMILILSFCIYVSTLHLFLLYIFSYSGLILVLTCFLFYLHCYSRCGRLSSYSLSKGRSHEHTEFVTHMSSSYSLSKGGCSLLVHVRPYSIFYFSITGYFYLWRVVRNDSLVRRLRRQQRSRPCAVGRLGTIERRRTVTVFVKPLLESPFF